MKLSRWKGGEDLEGDGERRKGYNQKYWMNKVLIKSNY